MTYISEEDEDYYYMGWQAYWAGIDYPPEDFNTLERRYWNIGWNKAEAEESNSIH